MMRILLLCLALASISACTQMTSAANKLSDNTRGAIYRTAERVQGYTRYEPKESLRKAPETAYCYQADSDIICYDSPKPYLSNKLLGYQGYTAPSVPASVVHVPKNASVSKESMRALAASANAPLPEGTPQPLIQRY